MEKKEREILVGESRIYLGEDNIIYITAAGSPDEKMAIANKEAAVKVASMVEGKVKVLLDITAAGKQSTETRRVWKEYVESEKFGKFALVGLHPVAQVIASFVMGLSKKKDMRFFKTKQEALVWLKE
jgi:hypothetical protein